MKRYYTLIQDFIPLDAKSLRSYLDDNGIKYSLGANFLNELRAADNLVNATMGTGYDDLMAMYIVLIEEYELSAIMLSVGGVNIIKNSPSINFKNTIRGWFRWML